MEANPISRRTASRCSWQTLTLVWSSWRSLTIEMEKRFFDLNIQRVLEHWSVSEALREIIANALDEAALTGSAAPEIFEDPDGAWHVRDAGRGLRYEHFTQNEDREKLAKPNLVIGKFGVGLKDAMAT